MSTTVNRHEKHCASLCYHDSRPCDCGVAANDPHWYKLRLTIIEALAKGYADCKHHQAFTRRLTPFFRKYVPDEFSVSVTPAENYSPDEVRVWGGRTLRYDHCDVRIALYRRNVNVASGDAQTSWQALFERELAAARERFAEAAKEAPREDKLTVELDKLQARLDEVKAEATALVTADGRGGFSARASSDLDRAYPDLLK